jgi:hypothetical protein
MSRLVNNFCEFITTTNPKYIPANQPVQYYIPEPSPFQGTVVNTQIPGILPPIYSPYVPYPTLNTSTPYSSPSPFLDLSHINGRKY